jgi:hypothetical protein
MQNLTPQEPEAAEGAPEPMEEAAEEAAVATGGEEATVPPEAALEVVVRSPEIVTPDFPKKTKCIPICMPGSSFMHIVTNK